MIQSDPDFIDFIIDVLVPDLRAAGFSCTAEDFERLIEIIKSEERWLTIKEAGMVKE